MKLHKLSPILWTNDLAQTISFYTTVLGFASKSNFPDFVSLAKGEVEIMFVVPKDAPDDCKSPDTPAFPKPSLTGSLFIYMENVDELWENVREKAVIKTTLADREYWMRDFSIFDNNGYELVFGQDITSHL